MSYIRTGKFLIALMSIAATSAGAQTFAIAIDARALSAPQFEIDGVVGLPTDTVASVDLTAATHTFSPNGPGFSFVVMADGTLDFDPALNDHVSGRGTSTLIITGFPIHVDATSLSSPQFSINRGNGGRGDTDVVTTLTMLPGDYAEFNAPAGSFIDFPFTVTTAGALDFDHALDGYVSGRDTNTLTVTGLPVNFDATAMSSSSFTIERGNAGTGFTDIVRTLHLLPGSYGEFNVPGGSESTSFPFVVSTSGTVDFDPSVNAYVSGRGTSTLTVTGLPLTVDATSLSTVNFGILSGAAGVRPTASPAVMQLLPGGYTFNSPNTPNIGFPFTFTTAATVTFDPAVDSFVSGRNTGTLRVVGLPITLDLTGSTAASFNLDAGGEGSGSTCAPVTFHLLPGGNYAVEVPASTQPPVVALTVTTAGTLDYVCDSMLDSCTESCVSGRGTNLVRITCGPRTHCGNGAIEACEQCDDGNTASGDCCSPTCQFDATGVTCTDDGNVCTDDQCNGSGGCNHNPNTRQCDDGLFCDGTDTCSGGSCVHSGDPCVTGPVCNNICNETADNCVSPAGTACPADANPCTRDVCDGATVCQHPAGNAGTPCADDGNVCTVDVCNGTSTVCQHPAGNAGVPCADDGNVCTVDACSGTSTVCQHPAGHAGTLCRPTAGVCDLPEFCDGTSPACPADTGKPDRDGDGICDANDNCPDVANPDQANGDGDALGDVCDPCTNGAAASKAKLTATKLLPPTGDDKLSIKGQAVVPSTPTLDLLNRGVRVLLSGTTGTTLADVTIPGGAYDSLSKTGWKVNATHTSWSYKSPGTATGGIDKVSVKVNPTVAGSIKFSLKGKNGTYAAASTDLPVLATLVLDVPTAIGGQCVEERFPATPPTSPSCVLLSGGATLKCK